MGLLNLVGLDVKRVPYLAHRGRPPGVGRPAFCGSGGGDSLVVHSNDLMQGTDAHMSEKDWEALWRSHELFGTSIPARERRDLLIARIALLILFISFGLMAAAGLAFIIMVLWRLVF